MIDILIKKCVKLGMKLILLLIYVYISVLIELKWNKLDRYWIVYLFKIFKMYNFIINIDLKDLNLNGIFISFKWLVLK